LISRSHIQEVAARGPVEPIATRTAIVDDEGARFIVRVAAALAAKEKAPKSAERPDPLGDYEPELYVGGVGGQHYALLNKYPVMAEHLLVVTRSAEPQERLLDVGDFAALAALLAELDWLAFYNGGRDAGASQGRKHLQLVPLPLAPEIDAAVPLEPLIVRGALPFRHAFAPLTHLSEMHPCYRELLARCAIGALSDERQSAPYNLLATRRWMLVVPRGREHYETISINALGFAGSLFVRSAAELERVRRVGPMSVLRAVTLQ
jgi:sulfate adenylyltransferase (ADP) / ATP adenylyltransferase